MQDLKYPSCSRAKPPPMGVYQYLVLVYADLPRLAHTRAMAAFAPALTPTLATPPAHASALKCLFSLCCCCCISDIPDPHRAIV